MAQHYSWKVKGKMTTCADCLLAKSRQKDVSKKPTTRSGEPGTRLMLDTTGVRARSIGGRKFWLVVMDDKSDFLWSYFMLRKSDQVDIVIQLLKALKAKGFNTKFIQCDNAGEN